MAQPFLGKTAFVSGASSGIGRAIAEEFGRRGLQVVLASRNLADVERVAAGIPGASAVQLDVRDEANWVRALDTAEARHGPLAVMVSNAGVSGSSLPLSETPSELWEWSRGVNLDGGFYGLSHGARRILASGQPGHIMATSSMAIFAAPAGSAPYIATKNAIIGLCECLRAELANDPVKVSVIVPASVKSNLITGNAERAPEKFPSRDMTAHAAAIANGKDPEVVARQAADALGTDEFWIFTHPELEHRMITRNAEMKAALDRARAYG
jgi:NAD(P)-dependent dehydrogenase (short-subunit alcohol dehydrogenase family)